MDRLNFLKKSFSKAIAASMDAIESARDIKSYLFENIRTEIYDLKKIVKHKEEEADQRIELRADDVDHDF